MTRSKPRRAADLDRLAHVLATARGSTAASRASACRRAGRRWRSCGCDRRAARRPILRFDGSTESTAMRLVGEVGEEAAHQLVDEARLAGAAGAGDAEHRAPSARSPAARARRAAPSPASGKFSAMVMSAADRSPGRALGSAASSARRTSARGFSKSHCAQEVVDHPLQAHRAAVVGRVDARRRRRRAARRSPHGRIVPPPPPNTLMFAPRSRSRSIMYLKYSTWPPW